MAKFIAITDIHISHKSNVRTGDLLEDLESKLNYVRDYCNKEDAQLIIPGDVFDKATVPDFVKSRLAPIFLSFKKTPFAIPGNHDILFNSDTMSDKTSLNVWFTHGVLRELKYEEYDDCILHAIKPMETKGKPQLAIFHGFLNQEDGRNTVTFADLNTTDKAVVVLGHDHVVYPPLKYGSVDILRPGSFLRSTRNEENFRQPNMLVIELIDGVWSYKEVPIESARSFEHIFQTKAFKVTAKEKKNTYEDVINHMKNYSGADISLEDALRLVTTPDVSSYIMSIANEENNKKVSK